MTSEATGLKRALAGLLPMAAVLLVAVLLMYPLALWLGLPLARKRMENLANWLVTTTAVHPLATAPGDADAGAASGALLEFGGFGELTAGDRDVQRLLLVRGQRPVSAQFQLEGDAVRLLSDVPGPLLTWGQQLEGPLDEGGRLFRLAGEAAEGAPPIIYLDDELLEAGAVESVERADGVNRYFTFPHGDGPVLVGDQLLLEGVGFSEEQGRVELERAPGFNTRVRRMTGDYAVLDAASGIIALARPSLQAPRLADQVLAVAELLLGDVDGRNRVFQLQHAPLMESDPARRLMLDGHQLSATAERPEERVDGSRATFTFAGGRGVVTLNGVQLSQERDYTRLGNQVTFSVPPPRNAQLRQYQDYLISDQASGTVTLAVAPQPGQKLWAAAYTYYDRPACGASALDCFFSMPQHPVPFPHWIAQRLVPFFSAYPVTDSRSVVRASLYTASGTLLALLLGGAVGVLLAVVFVAVRPAERALLPWVIASQTVPIIALVPVLLLLLGNVGVTVQTSLVPATLIGAYIAFFPVAVGTVTGLRSVDPLALDLMRSYAATPLQVFFKVRFPAAVPYFFTSLKLGTAAALVGALVAETESNNRFGLGYSIVGQVQAGNVSDVWILLLVSALLGIGLVALVGVAQRLLAPWERR